MKQQILWISLLLPLLALADPPEELGDVNWLRDFDEGLEIAAEKDKAIFLLFQEVPGCITCRNYGQKVLSHPLIVDAIQELFVPVAIFNNKGGKDAAVLKYYGEPSWNNPVVRIVDYDRLDIIPRVSGNYSPLGVVQAMVFALQNRGKNIPNYLQLLYEELSAKTKGTEQATLSMYCFWTGEKQYGQLDGVIETEAGFMHGQEVVQVTYDPQVISFGEILQKGKKQSCADQVFAHSGNQSEIAQASLSANKVKAKGAFRTDRTPKYYLAQTHYRAVPMTTTQAARANALIGSRQSPDQVLSPSQRALAAKYKKLSPEMWPNRIGGEVLDGWEN